MELAADIASNLVRNEPGSNEEHIKTLKGAYYVREGKTPEFIAQELQVSLDEAKSMLTLQMLVTGQDPATIAKKLNMTESKVREISRSNSSYVSMALRAA